MLEAWLDVRLGLLALGMAWMLAAVVASSAAFYAILRQRGTAPPLAEVVRTAIGGLCELTDSLRAARPSRPAR